VDDLLGTLDNDLEQGREGNTMRMSGRLSIVGMGFRHMKPEKGGAKWGKEGSCTERCGVVISMTGGVEGVERGGNRGLFFLFSLFLILRLVVYSTRNRVER